MEYQEGGRSRPVGLRGSNIGEDDMLTYIELEVQRHLKSDIRPLVRAGYQQ